MSISLLLIACKINTCSLPLARGRRRMCSLFCRGILRGSCWWGVFPSLSRCRLLRNVWVGSPVDSHSSQPPCGPHQARSLRAQRPLCSGPWPSCYQLRSDRTRSCLVGRSARRALSGLSPWCRAPDPRGRHGAHICHLEGQQKRGETKLFNDNRFQSRVNYYKQLRNVIWSIKMFDGWSDNRWVSARKT